MSPNTNERHASHYQWTLHAPEVPSEVYLSTRVFSCGCTFLDHSRSMTCPFSVGISISRFPLASCDSNHCLIVHGFAIGIIQCATSCLASSSLVPIACIKLFTTEYNASAPCFSITVSSSGSLGAPGNSHIVWKLQWQSQWNPGVAVTWTLNPILAFIAICQPTQFLVLYWWNLLKIPKLDKQFESWLLLDGFTLDS